MDIEKFNAETIAQEAISIINQRIHNLSMLNIIVCGKTGVGKSTLINAIFRDKLAETGIGKPVTQHTRKLTKKGIPLSIYDTRGFELGHEAQKQVKDEVIKLIKEGSASNDINKTIHCIWYCINTATNRVEQGEIEWLRELSKENEVTQVPIIIVLTQSFSKKNAAALKNELLNENLDVIQIVPLLADDYVNDDEYIIKSYGLETLLQIMKEALPKELLDTLQHVQIASLNEKVRHAQAAVATATLSAVTAAAVPIPFSDAGMLIPIQLTMIVSITVIFGLDINKSLLTSFLTSTLGSGGATLLGKAVVASLIKFIPGVGSIAGGAISAGTAGVITAALGEAYIGIMKKIYKGEMNVNDLGTKEGQGKMKELFKEQLSAKK